MKKKVIITIILFIFMVFNFYSNESLEEKMFYDILQKAMDKGNIKELQDMINNDKSKINFVGKKESKMLTPIIVASFLNHKSFCLYLIGNGVDLSTNDENGNNALFYTTSIDVINLLLRNQIDINSGNDLDQTPLFNAIQKGNDDIVAVLIKNGADINHQDSEGWTPLMHAVKKRSKSNIKLLLSKGAKKDTYSFDRETALTVTCRTGLKEIFKMLDPKDADYKFKGENGKTMLMYAESAVIANMLIEKGLDVNAKTSKGETPLMFASSENHDDVCLVLIEEGAEVNIKDDQGKTPLTSATANDSVDAMKVLLDNKAHINYRNKKKETPLMIAALNHSLECTKLLIYRGADVRETNDKFKDAIDYIYKKQANTEEEKTQRSELLKLLEDSLFNSSLLKTGEPTEYFVTTVQNLRLRSAPNLDGVKIISMKKGTELGLMVKSKDEVIDKDKGRWVLVKNEYGGIGWCFDAYLKKIKK